MNSNRGLNVYERSTMEARYIIENGATIRQTAKNFHLSKSTIYRDVTSILQVESPQLFEEIHKILKHNKEMAHVRGGEATKSKYRSNKRK